MKRTVKIHDVLHVFLGTSKESDAGDAFVDRLLATLKPNGHAAELDNGMRIFIEDVEVLDDEHRNVWDASGNRAKHERRRVCVTKEETRTLRIFEHIRYVYRKI